MNVVLLRVGIDTGSGGIHGPLFADGTFEFMPIPDMTGLDARTYGNTPGRNGRRLVEYFPPSRQAKAQDQSMHCDPEFKTFTYGDPSRPKAGLRRLAKGDLLIFYGGLQGWDIHSDPALYLFGYFEVLVAGRAADFAPETVRQLFSQNFHVRHPQLYAQQKEKLVLVKGSAQSRLLTKAVPISAVGQNRAGKPLKVLSPEMQAIFGSFGGKVSIQRSPPRWVDPAYTKRAAAFMRSLT